MKSALSLLKQCRIVFHDTGVTPKLDASAMGVYVTLDSIQVIGRTQFPEVGDHDINRLTYAAFRSKDFTSPPTYDFTSICSIFKDTTSTGSSRTGGKCSRSMCARRLL
jgi:hypothetical protein